jgi:hypothetical protein
LHLLLFLFLLIAINRNYAYGRIQDFRAPEIFGKHVFIGGSRAL